MKKTTYYELLRLVAGIAASLVLVGAIGLLSSGLPCGKSTDGIFYTASGLHPDGVMLSIDGQQISVEEYLYHLEYNCTVLTQMGVNDLHMELGEGITAADYVKTQTLSSAISTAALRAWAKDTGITLTEEEHAAVEAQAVLYEPQLSAMGVSMAFVKSQLRDQLLSNHLVELYTSEGGALRPADDVLLAKADEHGLMTVKVLTCTDAAQAETLLARMTAAADQTTEWNVIAAELQQSSAPVMIDGCEGGALVENAAALQPGECTLAEQDGMQLLIAREETDLSQVALTLCSETYTARCEGANVIPNDKLLHDLDVSAFYEGVTAARNVLTSVG